jgi:hypothetical protein
MKIMKTISKAGLKVKTVVKAGGIIGINHNLAGLKIKGAVAGLKVAAGVRAGYTCLQNHSTRPLAVA